jgi:hypothetical protein
MRVIHERPGWLLLDRERPSDGWMGLKLIATGLGGGSKEKRNWALGWNGGQP